MIGAAIGASAIGEDTISQTGGVAIVIPQGTAGTGGNIGPGGYFSKGQWHSLLDELRDARRERQGVLARAQRIKDSKSRRIIEAAARAAAQAIEAASHTQQELMLLRLAMEAVSGAKKVTEAVIEAQRLRDIALDYVALWEEQDEEDSAVLLL